MLNKMQICNYQEILLVAFDLLNLNSIKSQIFGSEAVLLTCNPSTPILGNLVFSEIKRSNHQPLQEQCQQQLPTN